MCGVTAMSRATKGTSILDGRQFLRAALTAIEVRGEHATGAAWGDPKDGHPYYWKEQGRARTVVQQAPFPVGMRTAIGHTRYATKGSPKKDDNNHPVLAPGIVLVHNGRVDNDDAIFGATGIHRQGEVDSEALAALLASPEVFGADHPADLLTLVQGVAAVAWLNVGEPDVLHLARLAVRPMTLGWTRRGDLVMSSTPQTLRHTGQLTGVRLERIEQVAEGTYLRVEAGVITERRRFPVERAARFVAEDVPAKSQVIDGIDWANLAPRRGWK